MNSEPPIPDPWRIPILLLSLGGLVFWTYRKTSRQAFHFPRFIGLLGLFTLLTTPFWWVAWERGLRTSKPLREYWGVVLPLFAPIFLAQLLGFLRARHQKKETP